MPIQTVAAKDVAATIEIEPEYAQGLRDLDQFSYLPILAYLYLMQGNDLQVVRLFIRIPAARVFATRSPCRPNPIELFVVHLVRVKGRTLIT